MPKISELPAISGVGLATNDMFPVVDTSAGASGSKRISFASLLHGLSERNVVSTITELKALASGYVDGFLVSTKGYRTEGKGAGLYRLDLTDTTTPDDGVFTHVSTAGQRWKFIGEPDAYHFGCYADGSTDDTANYNRIIAALNAGTVKSVFFPPSTSAYIINGTPTAITASDWTFWSFGAIFRKASSAGTSGKFFILGSTATLCARFRIHGIDFSIQNTSTVNEPCLDLFNCSFGVITNCRFLNIGQLGTFGGTNGSGTWYNTASITFRDCLGSWRGDRNLPLFKINRTANLLLERMQITSSTATTAAVIDIQCQSGSIDTIRIRDCAFYATKGQPYNIKADLSTGAITNLWVEKTTFDRAAISCVYITGSGTGGHWCRQWWFTNAFMRSLGDSIFLIENTGTEIDIEGINVHNSLLAFAGRNCVKWTNTSTGTLNGIILSNNKIADESHYLDKNADPDGDGDTGGITLGTTTIVTLTAKHAIKDGDKVKFGSVEGPATQLNFDMNGGVAFTAKNITDFGFTLYNYAGTTPINSSAWPAYTQNGYVYLLGKTAISAGTGDFVVIGNQITTRLNAAPHSEANDPLPFTLLETTADVDNFIVSNNTGRYLVTEATHYNYANYSANRLVAQNTFPGAKAGLRRVVKPSDTTRSTTTTSTDDPHLKFAVEANKKYRFIIRVLGETGLTADFKYQIGGPAGLSRISYTKRHVIAGGTSFGGISVETATGVSQSVNGTVDGHFTAEINGIVNVGSTAGTISLQWAQLTSDAYATKVFAGSTIEWEEI